MTKPGKTTVNRGWLKRQVEAGRVEARILNDYRSYADSLSKTDWMPARIKRGYNNSIPGQMNLWEHDFKTRVGRALKEDDGTITLIVHGNLSYSLRLI